MGRQQITIEDNSPIINNKTGGAPGSMNGSLLHRPVALPKAGWPGYAPVESAGINTNLPKVPVPVRQSKKHISTSNKAHTGSLATGKQGSHQSPGNIRSYKPYATYPSPPASPQSPADLSTTTRVKGSLLHWARRTPKGQ